MAPLAPVIAIAIAGSHRRRLTRSARAGPSVRRYHTATPPARADTGCRRSRSGRRRASPATDRRRARATARTRAAPPRRRRRRDSTRPSGVTNASATRQATAMTCITREIASDAGTPNRTGNGAQAVRAIEVEILAGVQHVEAADPGADRRRQQPRLPSAPAADREPAADRRDRHRQPEEQLRPRRVALRERVPEHDRQRDRRQARSTADSGARRRTTNAADATATNTTASRVLMAPRGSSRFAVRGFSASIAGVDEPVEPHRRAARRHHRDENPEQDLPPPWPASASVGPCARCAASSAPASANGSANTEWLKRTNDA